MRIAAGVILILTAVINLIACLGYLAGGTVLTAGTEFAETAIEESAAEGGDAFTADERAEIAEATTGIKAAGGLLLAFGLYLLVSVGILIAGAVFLFLGRQPTFILVAGLMAVVGELLGIWMTNFGVTNLIGLVGGALAIIASRSIAKSGAIPQSA